MKIKLSPSLLAADCANFEKSIKKLNDSVEMLHVDVMDGHFVPNISYGVPIVAAIKKVTDIPLDVHLMISNPLRYIKPFADAGADIISFHVEANDDISEVIDEIKKCGVKAAVALKPGTSLDVILPYLGELDMVLQMTVEPGFGGQALNPAGIDNIRKLRAQSDIDIQVDGGVKAENVAILASAGANVIVAGTAIFGANDPKQAADEIRKAGEEA